MQLCEVARQQAADRPVQKKLVSYLLWRKHQLWAETAQPPRRGTCKFLDKDWPLPRAPGPAVTTPDPHSPSLMRSMDPVECSQLWLEASPG